MPRSPIEQEVKGLKTPRERVWTAIRQLRSGFTVNGVQDACVPLVRSHVARDYMLELLRAGYIVRSKVGARIPGRPGMSRYADEYTLAKDQYEAPRLNNGKPVTVGSGTLAMWRVIKALQKGFTYKEVAAAASQNGVVVKDAAAKFYVYALARAGYLRANPKAEARSLATFVLVKNTGPHAPVITRLKAVFDRNTGKFAELETPQEVCDALPE